MSLPIGRWPYCGTQYANHSTDTRFVPMREAMESRFRRGACSSSAADGGEEDRESWEERLAHGIAEHVGVVAPVGAPLHDVGEAVRHLHQEARVGGVAA